MSDLTRQFSRSMLPPHVQFSLPRRHWERFALVRMCLAKKKGHAFYLSSNTKHRGGSSKRNRAKNFAFDHAFRDKSVTKDVYQASAATVVPSVLQGYNATVFAYGSTGAGKTHTMLGYDKEPVCALFFSLSLSLPQNTKVNTNTKHRV